MEESINAKGSRNYVSNTFIDRAQCAKNGQVLLSRWDASNSLLKCILRSVLSIHICSKPKKRPS